MEACAKRGRELFIFAGERKKRRRHEGRGHKKDKGVDVPVVVVVWGGDVGAELDV